MKRHLMVLLLLVSVFLLSGCSAVNEMPKEMPSDFGFVIKYGIGAKNELDTFNGRFTKDLITAGTATTELKLSQEEMARIYEEMRKMNIMSYPEEFKPGAISLIQSSVAPYQTYYFKVSYSGKIKEIRWQDENLANTASARDLRNLSVMINAMVEKKVEFKQLPPAVGGYE